MPGAGPRTGWAALPSEVGGSTSAPERSPSQAAWSVHQLPGWVTAPACHSVADSGRASLTRKLDFLFVGGLTSAAMWPAVDSTKRVLPPSRWTLR